MIKRILLFLSIILQISVLHISAIADTHDKYLKGKFYSSVKDHFLIATKKMIDGRFKKTLIVMLENNKDGAWGLVINKPLGSVPLALLIDPSLSSLKEREDLYKVKIPIFWGGPVETTTIFVLHSNEYKSDSTNNYGDISISQDYDILFDLAKNRGPEKSLVILGYSGWGGGQLEGEMERGGWILSEADIDIIFDERPVKKWLKAQKKIFIRL